MPVRVFNFSLLQCFSHRKYDVSLRVSPYFLHRFILVSSCSFRYSFPTIVKQLKRIQSEIRRNEVISNLISQSQQGEYFLLKVTRNIHMDLIMITANDSSLREIINENKGQSPNQRAKQEERSTTDTPDNLVSKRSPSERNSISMKRRILMRGNNLTSSHKPLIKEELICNTLNITRMQAIKLLELEGYLVPDEDKQAQEKDPWTTQELEVQTKQFAGKDESPALQYPRDSQHLFGNTVTYPLSAKTFVRTIRNAAYFGQIHDNFNPFLPYDSQNQKISFTKFAQFQDEAQKEINIEVRHSRVSMKAYVFEIQWRNGTIRCYPACPPAPGAHFDAFIIFEKIGIIKFAIDPSNDPDFDFDILYYNYFREGLVFMQVDLWGRKIRKRRITQTHGSINSILSSQVFICSDDAKSGKAYDYLQGEICSVQKFRQGVSLMSCTVYITTGNYYTIFIKKQKKFFQTQFYEWQGYIANAAELNGFVFIQGIQNYYIFKLQPEGPQCIYHAPYSCEQYQLALTTAYILEYRNHHIWRCVPFNLLHQNSSKDYHRLQQSSILAALDDWVVIGHLNERDLAYSKSKGFFLISPNAPPESCFCFQNQMLTEISAPLLLQVRSEIAPVFLIWDGDSLHQIEEEGYFDIKRLLCITDWKIYFGKNSDQLMMSTMIGPKYWGVILRPKLEQKQKVHFETKLREWFTPYYYIMNDLLDYLCTQVLNFKICFPLVVGGSKYLIKRTLYESLTIWDFDEDAEIEEVQIRVGLISAIRHFKNQVIMEFSQSGDRSYRLQYFRFRMPLDNDYSFTFENIKYSLRSGARGVLLFIPIKVSTDLYASIGELVNSYLSLKASGINLQFSGQQDMKEIDKGLLQEGYELLERAETYRWKSGPELEFINKIEELYFNLDKCQEVPLVFFTLCEFNSLKQIDSTVAQGQFISSFARRLSSAQDKRILTMFSRELGFLHSQAEDVGMSLSFFYDTALQEIEDAYIEAPKEEVLLELKEDDQDKFKDQLRTLSAKQKRKIKLYRSGLKLPSSNHEMALALTEQLSETQDLIIFETKLIQLYIQKRWEDSFWFFFLDYTLLVTSLFVLFLYVAFFRIPYVLILLLVIQLWNASIEAIEIRNKKCAYFSDFWNYFDILRFVFAFTYFGIDIAGIYSSNTRTIILTLLSFFQSFKVFQIFSLFKSTRVLLRIVIEIVKDMIPFMLFVLVTTITVSLLYTSAVPDEKLTNVTYTDYLMHVYHLDFGDFSTDDYTSLDTAIFILAVIIVPLVLLNMLIAIMGDTFGRVKEEQARRDFQEMAGLVYRYEIVAQTLCRRKRSKEQKYLFVSEEVNFSSYDTTDEWQERIKAIKTEIEKNQKKQEEWHSENDSRFQENEEWKKKQDVIYKKQQEEQVEQEQWRARIEEQLKKNQEDSDKSNKELLDKILKAMGQLSSYGQSQVNEDSYKLAEIP